MFYGRDELLDDLLALFRKRTSSLVTCRGRRRIGKSTLIEAFAGRADARFIRIEGLRPAAKLDNAAELAHFAAQLSAQTGCDATPPSDWLNAFLRLDRELGGMRRTVVLLDEISWMAHYDPTFAGTLKTVWDGHLKRHPKLVLVLCGSVSTWIRDHIVDDGTFYGRRSLDIVVPELPLSECVKFWGRAAERIDRREIVDVLSVTGGVPRYLEEIDPGATAAENIRRLCFRPKGVLREDFDEMFTDVITRQPTFTGRVLRLLVDGPRSAARIGARLGGRGKQPRHGSGGEGEALPHPGQLRPVLPEIHRAGQDRHRRRKVRLRRIRCAGRLGVGDGVRVREPRAEQLDETSPTTTSGGGADNVRRAVAAGGEPRGGYGDGGAQGRAEGRAQRGAREGRPQGRAGGPAAADAPVAVRRRGEAATRDRAGGDRRSRGEGPADPAPRRDVRPDGARLRGEPRAGRRGGRILRRRRPVPGSCPRARSSDRGPSADCSAAAEAARSTTRRVCLTRRAQRTRRPRWPRWP